MPLMGAAHKRPAVGIPNTIAYQTVPPTPPDPTTPALLPSRNQRPRHLCALLAGRGVYGEAVQVERVAG